MDFWLFLFWYQPYSATYQIFQEMQSWYPFSITSYTSQENCKKPINWAAFVWIQKSTPRKIYFFSDFIRTYLCASLDSGIWRCHQSQTWRHQGAALYCFLMLIFTFCFLSTRDYDQNYAIMNDTFDTDSIVVLVVLTSTEWLSSLWM